MKTVEAKIENTPLATKMALKHISRKIPYAEATPYCFRQKLSLEAVSKDNSSNNILNEDKHKL